MKIIFVSRQHQDVANFLRKHGHEVIEPSIVGDFAIDTPNVEKAIESAMPEVVIGAADGGSIVMKLNPTQPIILLAPTFKKDQVSLQKFAVVVHGALDDIVPAEDSLELENVRIYLPQDTHWFRDHGLKVLLGILKGFEKQ